jgi:hypothetical protein
MPLNAVEGSNGGAPMSSPGEIYVYAQEKELLSALLYNFDVNSAAVKTDHSDWLKANTPRYFARDMRSIVVGLASRTGGNDLNRKLSLHRATNVDTIFRALAPPNARPVMDLRLAFGEDAAAITGSKDGVEDRRWRAVFFAIMDPHKVTLAEVLQNDFVCKKDPVQRRTHAQLIVGQTLGGSIPMDEHDRAAEGWFQLGQDLAAKTGISGNQIREEKTALMDETNTILNITIKRTDVGKMAIIKLLDVDYDWQPLNKLQGDKRTLTIKPYDDELKQNPSMKDEILPLSVEQMNQWLNHPYNAWSDLHRF